MRRLFGERLEDRAMLAVLFSHDADDPVRALVPTQTDYDDLGFDWLGGNEPFDDAAWTATSGASNAVGYDRGAAYDPLLGLDVELAMYNVSPTVFVRAAFDVADPQAVDVLTLRMRYDDGFIAWLNGTEVARVNASGLYPAWSAAATAAHQASTTAFDVFDLTSLTSELRAGTNVLAIRAFNATAADDDALVQFTLTGESRTGPPLARDDTAATDENQPVTINVLANDDEGSNPIAPGTVQIATPPAHGTATANANGTITYTPTSLYNGADTFTYTVADTAGSGQPITQTLIASNAPVKAFVPPNNNLGTTWRGANEPFNDAGWMNGTFGVGYDTNTAIDYNPFIGLNVQSALQNVNTTVYIRSTFNIASPTDVTALTLRMRYDDGFAAFINGVQIASAFAPANLTYNSTTSDGGTNGDANAVVFQTFNVGSFISALRPGTNVLAIHGLNASAGSSDLLMQAELVGTIQSRGQRSNAATVTVNVTGVDYPPIARDDSYSVDEGQTLDASTAGDLMPGPGQFVWPIAQSGNGHLYQSVSAGAFISWSSADAAARAMGGHLATVSSAAENDFIFQIINDNRYWYSGSEIYLGPWIGGLQPAGSAEPSGGWQWVTGEAFGYSNWAPGEPNNVANGDRIHYFSTNMGAPGAFWNDQPGTHTYVPTAYVVEWDAATTSQTEIVVPAGSTWLYRDTGALPPNDAQGDTWKQAAYDDAGWASGLAQLGYGDGDEATVVNCGPSRPACNSGNSITTWFRKHFTLAPGDATRATALAVELLRDDGASVYVNGVEVLRSNMPGTLGDSSIDASTHAAATATVADETTFLPPAAIDLLSPAFRNLLRDGDNVVAVEVHQVDPTSSDISFDLRLSATIAIAAGVLGNDTEPDGQTMTAVLATGPEHGALDFHADGTFTYTPSAGFVGVDTFTYRASDGVLLSDPATVTITVNHVPPTAQPDAYITDEDTALSIPAEIGVLANDTDTQLHPLSASVVATPTHGTLALAANGAFTYTPGSNYNGPDAFTYRASDGTLQSNVVSVALVVDAIADAPVAVDDFYETMEGQALVAGVNTGQPGNLPAGMIYWSPAQGGNGHVYERVVQTQTWNDARRAAESRTFGLTAGTLATITSAAERNFLRALGANEHWLGGFQDTQSPNFVEPAGGWEWLTGEPWNYTSWNPGEPNNSGEEFLSGGGNDSWNDLPNIPLNEYWVEYPINEPIRNDAVIPSGAVWRYLDNGSNQATAWRERAFDDSSWLAGPAQLGYGEGDEATVVSFGNSGSKYATTYFRRQFNILDPHAMKALTLEVLRDDGIAVYLNGTQILRNNLAAGAAYNQYASSLASDDGQTWQIFAGVDPSLLVAGFNTLAVEIHQANGTSDDLTFDLRLTGTRRLNAGVLENDSDPDGPLPTEAVQTSQPSHGTLNWNGDGKFTYTPAVGFAGVDSFTYQASDGENLSAPATVSVTAHHTPPTAAPETYSVTEDATLVVPTPTGVLANDVDTLGHTLSAVMVSEPAYGTLTFNANGSFDYTPIPNYHGADMFAYRARDGALESNVATVTINVVSVADSPIARADTYHIAQDETISTTPTTPDYATTVLMSSPIAYWRLGETATSGVAVDIVSGFNGQFVGGVARGAAGAIVGDENTAVDFDGAGRIDMGFRSALNLGNNFSIEAWIRPDAVNGYRHFINTWNGPQGYGFGIHDGRMAFATYGIFDFETATSVVTPGRWYHLAVVFDAANDATFFLDGNVVQMVAGSSPARSSSQSFAIGATSVINDPINRAFDGRIDEVAFYNHVLTADEIREHFLVGIGVTEIPTTVPAIARGATWKYRDNIANGAAYPVDTQADLWTENNYDDAAWPSGAAMLGFGGIDAGPIVTTIGGGTVRRTTLFRRAFNVQGAERATTLSFDALFDDGASVYVNGREVLRYNMPGTLGDGTIRTDALSSAAGDEASYHAYTVDLNAFPGLLVEGANTIAVELHQVSDTSSDLGFDLALSVTLRPDPRSGGELANDTDGDDDVLTTALVAGTYHGVLDFKPDGSFTYTPAAGFSGVDQFTYRANDGTTASNLALVTINVGNANEAPLAADDRYVTWSGRAVAMSASRGTLANDFDANGDPLTAAILSQPQHGTLDLSADGAFTYTPQPGFEGVDSFSYRAGDGTAAFGVATATIDVLRLRDPINAIPQAAGDDFVIALEAGQSVAAPGVLVNDVDAEGEPLDAVIEQSPWHGSLSFTSDGGFVYTPRPGFIGDDSFTYRVTDGNTFSSPTTVALHVTAGAALGALPVVPPAPTSGATIGSSMGTALTSAFGSGDLNGDGQVTRHDVAALLHRFGSVVDAVASASQTLSGGVGSGDLNGDRVVDLRDLILLRNALATGESLSSSAFVARRSLLPVAASLSTPARPTIVATRRTAARPILDAKAADRSFDQPLEFGSNWSLLRRRTAARASVAACW